MSAGTDIRNEIVLAVGGIVGGAAAGAVVAAVGAAPVMFVAAIALGAALITAAWSGRLIVNLTGIVDPNEYPIGARLVSLVGAVCSVALVVFAASSLGLLAFSFPIFIFSLQVIGLGIGFAAVAILVLVIVCMIIGYIHARISPQLAPPI